MLSNKQLGEYKLLKVLKQGDHFTVYLCFNPLKNKYYALKAIPKSLFPDPSLISEIERKISKLMAIRSWQLTKIYETNQTDKNLSIILEHCPHHSLNEYINVKPFRRVSEQEAIKIIRPLSTCGKRESCCVLLKR